jgi:uncharacterized membrane protein
MFFTPEYSFRKLHPNQVQFSRTPFLSEATDVQGVRLKPPTRAKAHTQRMTTMLRKITLALVAAASLAAMALAPTAASAGWKGGGFHHHHHHFGHHHFGPSFGIGYVGGYGGDGCYVTRRVLTPFGVRWRTVNICRY